MLTIGAAVVGVLAMLSYFLLRAKPNQFPNDIAKMSARERADVLVSATIWRLRWEADNPNFRGIFLSPGSYAPEVCRHLFHSLLNTVVQLSQNHQTLARQLQSLGVGEPLSDAEINGCRVWMGTIGTRGSKIKRDDMLRVWSCLQEAFPFVDESLATLAKRQEVQRSLGRSADLLLGQDVRRVISETRNLPVL